MSIINKLIGYFAGEPEQKNKINEIVNFINSKKEYVSLLSQTATNDPTKQNIIDNLTQGGSILFARTGVGVYTVTGVAADGQTGLFTANKTYFSLQNTNGSTSVFSIVRTSDSVLTITTYDGQNEADELLLNTPFTITVSE